jgi:hypothetical protein
MKKGILFFVFFIGVNTYAQNKQILYDFAELPRTLLLNPGLETNYKYHFGLPLFSSLSAELGITGLVLSDIFVADTRSINNKIGSILKDLKAKDYVKFNTQIEVFSAGYRLSDKTYLSLGFYQESDGIFYFPKDLATLAIEGNGAYINESFDLSQINYKLDVLGVLHAGITRKVDANLTIGGRFKVYSSAINFESTNNSGTFITNLGGNNTYTSYIENVNLNFQSSGIQQNDQFISDPSVYLKNMLLGGNLGIGLDLGFTYHVTSQLQFSGSLLDVGFVNHTKDIKNSLTAGSYTFDGLDFEYDDVNRDYWEEFDSAIKEQLPTIINEESYISWRPSKLNLAVKHSFGEKRTISCYDDRYKDFYTDAFGMQLYSILRPLSYQFALTGFYEKSFTDKFHLKLTYTVDDYSYYNIGFGLSAQIWKFNVYGMLDNVSALSDVSSANNVSAQFGINLILN